MTDKPLFLLGSVVVLTCLVIASSSISAPVAPVENEEKPVDIRGLLRERIRILKEVRDVETKGFEAGTVHIEQLLNTKNAYLRAIVDSSETNANSIGDLKEVVKDAEAWQDVVHQGFKNGQVGRSDELKAKAFVLEARIALERAKGALERAKAAPARRREKQAR